MDINLSACVLGTDMPEFRTVALGGMNTKWIAVEVTKRLEWPFAYLYLSLDPAETVTMQDPRAIEAARQLLAEASTWEQRDSLRRADVVKLAERYQIRYGEILPIRGTVCCYGATRQLSILPELKNEYAYPYITLPHNLTAGDCFDFVIETDVPVNLKAWLNPHNIPSTAFHWREGSGALAQQRQCKNPVFTPGSNAVEALVFGYLPNTSNKGYKIRGLRYLKQASKLNVFLKPLGNEAKDATGRVSIGKSEIKCRTNCSNFFSFDDGIPEGATLPVVVDFDIPVCWSLALLRSTDLQFDPVLELVQR